MTKKEARHARDAAYASAHATYCVAIEDCCILHAPRRRHLAYARTYRAALDAADAAYNAAIVDKEQQEATRKLVAKEKLR